MRTSRVVNAVRRFGSAHAVGGAGVVAVSGGADSVALLRALVAAGCGPLTVAHLNHRLRADESDADEAFARELATHLGVGFRSERTDVATFAQGDNLEATARRVRYEFFDRVARQVGAAWIATGHTADDQAETILHRLVRGTGLQGLRGIAPERAGTPTIIRPLLAVTRADILDYLATLDQPFREDRSNADPRFTRNRIRADLLPLLKTFNTDVVAALNRLAEQAGEAHDVIAEQGRALLVRAERPRAGDAVILDPAELLRSSPVVIRTALRFVWEREGWPLGEMGHDQWERAVAVVRGEAGGWDFPGGVSARRRGRVVQLASRKEKGKR